MKKCVFLLILLISISCQRQKKLSETHYSFELTINPTSQFIDASLNLEYVHPFNGTDSLSFLLHENLNIESVQGEQVESFVFDTIGNSPYQFTQEAGVLKVKLKEKISKNEIIDIKLKYSGNIGIVSTWKINRITEDWVELGMYSPWFPYNPGIEKFTFQTKLMIDNSYKVAGNGDVRKVENYWLLKSNLPVKDIIITASKSIKEKEIVVENFTLKLSSAVELSDSIILSIMNHSKKILQIYNVWFGSNNISNASIIITPREIGGGYARKGLIVLSKLRNIDYKEYKEDYIRYFAHEFAHLWWSNAPSNTWEDWLNESFAEYSALLAIRHILGEKEFERRIEKKAANLDTLPAVRGLDRKHDQAYMVLYDKGCYLLYELEQEIGSKKYFDLMKSVYSSRVSNTEDFLSVLTNILGKEIAQKFNSKLEE